MKQFQLSVNGYREKLTADYCKRFGGYISTIHQAEINAQVQEFANAKAAFKAGQDKEDFNVWNNDPNCKSCKKPPPDPKR